MKTFSLIFLYSASLISQIDVKQDKLAHFGAGALVSVLAYGPIHKLTKSAPKALLYSTACAVLVGAMKEAYDLKYGKTDFNGADLAMTAFGGFTASSVITISVTNKSKRKQLEKIEKLKKEEQLLPKEIPVTATITDVGLNLND